jgi:Ca2+-binding EF-hand superfamily protein
MYELFKLGATGGGLDLQGFTKIIEEVSEGNVGNPDIELTFKFLPKNKTGKVSFQTFEEVFRSEVPTNAEFETKVIRSVRQWMYDNNLSSEMAFDTLCRSAGRFIE